MMWCSAGTIAGQILTVGPKIVDPTMVMQGKDSWYLHTSNLITIDLPSPLHAVLLKLKTLMSPIPSDRQPPTRTEMVNDQREDRGVGGKCPRSWTFKGDDAAADVEKAGCPKTAAKVPQLHSRIAILDIYIIFYASDVQRIPNLTYIPRYSYIPHYQC